MMMFARITLSALVFIAVHFFSYWMIFVQILPENLSILAGLASLLAAAAASRSVWKNFGKNSGGLWALIGCGAAIGGAIGFCGGFFGPMIFTPEANQGPLLGLFITGPLGLVGGGIIGLGYGVWKKRKQ